MTHASSQVDDVRTLVIQCGRVIDGTGAPPWGPCSLVVEGGVLRAIASTGELGSEIMAGASLVVDATDATVLPGLIDLHVHLASVVDPDEPHPLLAMMGASPPLLALHAAKNARLVLEAGFTTVRDLAGTSSCRNAEVVALRQGVEIGLVPGPRIFAAGWVNQTGGHLDQTLAPAWRRPDEDRADGPWGVRRQVREMVLGGVDLIKTSEKGHYTYEEWEALVDEAHALGRRVAVHSRSVASAKQALHAGMDTIEHGWALDDEAMGLLVDRGAFLVPTLSGRGHKLANQLRKGAPPAVVREHQAALDSGLETVRRAREAGVKIACGTDTYRSLREHWGENAFELEMLVQAGLPPLEAIVAATRVNAEALGQQDRLGTLEVGKAADLLVFEGDPVADIRQLQERERIRLVIKGGQIVVDRRGAGPALSRAWAGGGEGK